MLIRPFIALLLFFCLASCATILRSVPSTITNGIETAAHSSPSRYDAQPVGLRRVNRRETSDDTAGSVHETPLDWREDEALRLESEREAGFRVESHPSNDDDDDQYPLPAFWPLFKICVVSAIAIAVLKIVRDLRG